MAVLAENEILTRVQRIITEQLGVGVRDVGPEINVRDDLCADSLDELEIIMEIEDEFEIEISDEDADRLHTVQDAVTYLLGRKVEA